MYASNHGFMRLIRSKVYDALQNYRSSCARKARNLAKDLLGFTLLSKADAKKQAEDLLKNFGYLSKGGIEKVTSFNEAHQSYLY